MHSTNPSALHDRPRIRSQIHDDPQSLPAYVEQQRGSGSLCDVAIVAPSSAIPRCSKPSLPRSTRVPGTIVILMQDRQSMHHDRKEVHSVRGSTSETLLDYIEAQPLSRVCFGGDVGLLAP